MAVDVLGRRVDHHVHPELDRPLEIGRQEGVVADADGAVTVRQLAHRRQVHQVHERVGGRLDPNRLRAARQLPFELIQPPQVDVVRLDPLVAHDGLEQAVGAAVQIVVNQNSVPRLEHHEHRGLGRHAGGEGEASGAALQRRQALFQRLAGRVPAPRIVERPGLVHAAKSESRGLVDGDHDRSLMRGRMLPRMDR